MLTDEPVEKGEEMMKSKFPQINYTDYQGLIINRAKHWSKRIGWDFQELMSEGNMTFMKAMKIFNPSRSRFSTHLWKYLNTHFRNLGTRKWETAPGAPWPFQSIEDSGAFLDQLPCACGDGNPERMVMLKEMIEGLSHDARLLVKATFETPRDLIWMFRGRKGRLTVSRYTLQRYFMMKRGWTESRSWHAFSEIKEALKTL